jgi:hypothetical protein
MLTLERPPTCEDVADRIHATAAGVGREQLAQLREIARMPERTDWDDWGARDYPHWLAGSLGISYWKASRMIEAAHHLEHLPLVARALERGRLSLEQVLELARFATPGTEAELIGWAALRAPGAIRHRADLERRRSAEEVAQNQQERSVRWWFHDDRFELEADLPAAEGTKVARALDRLAARIPTMPGESEITHVAARRADALVMLSSGSIAADPDPDRATVIVHARAGVPSGGGAEIEDGPPIDRRSLERMRCDARVQTLLDDASGDVIAVSSVRRDPPAWMVREVRRRDRTCRFPGCDARRFTQVHHIRFWSRGGKTELANLLLICSFHHRLVHELGWRIERLRDGEVQWFRPGGVEFHLRR